jgi:hypothetical protein
MQEPWAGIEPPVSVTVTPPASALTTPPQVVLPLYPEITTPGGRLSISGAVRTATVPLGLVKVMVTTDFPPALMVIGLKILVIVTPVFPAVTIKVAIAGTVLLPLLVCSAPTGNMFTKLPAVAPVTRTVTTQAPFAGIAPPVKVTVELAAMAVTTPPQVLLALLPDTVTPLGRESIRGAVMVAMVLLGFVKVIVRVEVPPAVIVAGLNDLLSTGATFAGVTVNVEIAGPALLPLLVCNAPAATVFTKLPAFAAVTNTVTLQEPLAGIAPPVNVTVEPPTGALTAPPQVVLPPLEINTPVGRVSINGEVMVAAVSPELFNVSVRVEVPPAPIDAGPKALPSVIDGGVTASVAMAGAALLPLLVCNAPVGIALM